MACGHIQDEILSDLLRIDQPAANPSLVGATGCGGNIQAAATPAREAWPRVNRASGGSSMLEGLSWQRCENAREGMLTMQKAMRARIGRTLDTGTSCAHLVVLLRIKLTGALVQSPPKSGLLYFVDMAESIEECNVAPSISRPVEDESTQCFRRCVMALAMPDFAASHCANTSAEGIACASCIAVPPPHTHYVSIDPTRITTLFSRSVCSTPLGPQTHPHPPMHASTLTTLLHELGAFTCSARPMLLVCIAPGRDAYASSLASLRFAELAMSARLMTPELVRPRGDVIAVVGESQLAPLTAISVRSTIHVEEQVAALPQQVVAQDINVAQVQHRVFEADWWLAELHVAESDIRDVRDSALHVEFAHEARVLGFFCRQVGKVEEAVRLHQRARRLHMATLGATHRQVARDLFNLGNVFCDLGRLDEAAAAYKDAHEIDLASLGAEHVDTATDIGSLGMVFAVQNRWKEALPLLQQAQGVLVSCLEPQAPNLIAIKCFCREIFERVQSTS